jgi:hypothetical protein
MWHGLKWLIPGMAWGGLLILTGQSDEGVSLSFATDAEPREEEPATFSAPAWKGSVQVGADYHPQESITDPDDEFLLTARLDFRLTGSIGDFAKYVLAPRLRISQDGIVREHVEILEMDEARPLFTFREAFMDFYQGDWELSVGKRIYTWGTGDGTKPTDVINPRDHLVVPEDEKIGVPSLALTYNTEWVTATGIFVPWFSPSRLPQFDSRWYPDPTPIIQAYRAAAPGPPNIVFAPRELPEQQLKNVQGGIQLSSSRLITGWDLNLNYYRGIDANGDFLVTRTAPFPDLEFTQFFSPYHMGGGSFSTTWGDFEFHGEAAYFDTDNNAIDADYLSYIGGINYTWYPDNAEWFNNLMVILEYAGEHVTRDRETALALGSRVDRGLTEDILSRLLFSFSDDMELELDAGYNVSDDDVYHGAEFRRKIGEEWQWIFGVDFYWGQPDTFFGAWRRNDRIYSRMIYYF